MTYELKDGRLTHAGRELLRDVSFVVEKGQLKEVRVPSGGAEVVLHALMGLVPLDSGIASLDGESLTALSASYLRRHMGYVPRSLSFPDRRERRYAPGELRRMLVQEVAAARKAVVLAHGMADEERPLFLQMAGQGAAVVVVREEE